MIVITRGSSPLGRLVVRHLLKRVPPRRIAVTTPDPHDAADLAELGIDVRPESLRDPDTAERVFVDAEAAFIHTPPGQFGDGVPGDDVIACASGAIAAGAEYLVYTSVINAAGTHHLRHLVAEQHIKDSGVAFTFLRNNLQSEALLPALRLALSSDEFVCSFRGGLIAPAARTDFAEAAAVVLSGGHHRGQALELSGPLGLNATGIASVISQIAGRPIRAREVAPETLVIELIRAGAPEAVAAELAEINNDTRMGEWERATQTLEDLIGHRRLPLFEALSAAAVPAG